MKSFPFIKISALFSALILSMPSSLWAAKDVIGIAPVAPAPAMAASVAKDGKGSQLDQVLQALDAELVNGIHSTRKFAVVARGDLKVVLTEQALANSGNVDAADKNAAQQFKLAGAKFVVATHVTGFSDFQGKVHIEGEHEEGFRRTLSLSAALQIYDSTTSKLLESASYTVRTNVTTGANLVEAGKTAELSNELLTGIAREMARKSAGRVVEVLYPAKVIDVTESQVTLSWGDGTSVAEGQTWDVFQTKSKQDPDDPDKTITIEIPVGSIRIERVTPNSSVGNITEEKQGKKIAEGYIARLKQ